MCACAARARVSVTTVYWSVVPEAMGVDREVDVLAGAEVDGGAADGAGAAGVAAGGGGPAEGDVIPGMGVTSSLVRHCTARRVDTEGVPFGRIL